MAPIQPQAWEFPYYSDVFPKRGKKKKKERDVEKMGKWPKRGIDIEMIAGEIGRKVRQKRRYKMWESAVAGFQEFRSLTQEKGNNTKVDLSDDYINRYIKS